MNDPIQTLKDENSLLLQAVETARQVQQIRDNETYHFLMHDIILFFRNFTEIYHYPKEDKVLYPLLKDRTEAMNPNFILQTCNSHDDLEELLCDIIDAHVSHNYRLLRTGMTTYLDELSCQVELENQTILNIAPDLLTNAESEDLYDRFKKIDEHNGTKERLKIRYLNVSNRVRNAAYA